MPEKVRIYIETNLLDELKYFQKKYSIEIKILANDKFIIPEYKIELLSKSKKPINNIEHINSIKEVSRKKSNYVIAKKVKENLKNKDKDKDKVKKAKNKKTIKTLWVRRRKKV